MSLIQVAIGVDHRDLDAVYEADRVDAHLAIVIAIIGPLHGRSAENPSRILKADAMPAEVCSVLGRIPRKPHRATLYRCRDVKSRRALHVTDP